jgi:hypothetical protein
VCAAASPGAERKRRRRVSSAEEKFGDRKGKNKSTRSIGQREVNLEAGKEKETCSCNPAIGGTGPRPIRINVDFPKYRVLPMSLYNI